MVVALAPHGARAEEPSGESLISVIVRETPGAGDGPERLVASVGGTVGRSLDLIGGFEASVPSRAVARLAASPEIAQVTPNAVLELNKAGWEDASTLSGSDPETSASSLYEVARYMRADDMWDAGYTGSGVDIALIDSGVVPVNGLTARGKVFNGPDLSFESQYDSLRYLDTFGHGTHMAGIMAGRDDAATNTLSTDARRSFVGIAPDARVVSIKVADAQGVTDVSQVIAAIDWVVQHRRDGDLDIRVLNLSFGTNSTQSYVLDPLSYAVERAWNEGIVVVVAAGNDGNAQPLRNPAIDPFVIAVGAVDPVKTKNPSDDVVTSFSNCGTAARSVDVVAHGRSITSLRAPGSHADLENPGSVVADRLFVGSGTSQAAAVVSGAVALLLDENPDLSPDQVKWALTSQARPVKSASDRCQGGGVVDVVASAKVSPPAAAEVAQPHKPSTGAGSLDESRGSDRITGDGVVLKGEQDIMGNPWIGFNEVVTTCVVEESQPSDDGTVTEPVRLDSATLEPVTLESSKVDLVTLEPVKVYPVTLEPEPAPELAPSNPEEPTSTKVCSDELHATNTLWNGGDWNGATWSGATWSGATWSGATWSGATWSGATWSSVTWSGATWSGATWSGATWSGATWSGATWSGATWSGATWSGLGWLGFTWH
jgi:serine protease AprX